MPDTVSATVSCQDNSLKVSWSESRGADSFTASVEDGGGSGTTCQAMSAGFCNVSGLSCGQLYHVSVVASDGYCNSPPTESVVAPSGELPQMLRRRSESSSGVITGGSAEVQGPVWQAADETFLSDTAVELILAYFVSRLLLHPLRSEEHTSELQSR